MNGGRSNRSVAERLATAGGAVGAVAGVTQAAVGSRIPDWTGNKNSPIALGLLTTVLSLSVIAAARSLRTGPAAQPGKRTAVGLWCLVVGGLCFTTAGRLWYIPGALMLAACATTTAACGLHTLQAVIATNWMRGLLALLGGFSLLMAVSAGPVITIAAGIIAGCALLASAVLLKPANPKALLLLAATVPFAALTWWSLITIPLTITATIIGLSITRHDPPVSTPNPTRPASLQPS